MKEQTRIFGSGTNNDLKGKRVLVVEDFAMNREIMSDQLKNHRAQVVEAEDGDEAITLGLRPGIDLICVLEESFFPRYCADGSYPRFQAKAGSGSCASHRYCIGIALVWRRALRRGGDIEERMVIGD